MEQQPHRPVKLMGPPRTTLPKDSRPVPIPLHELLDLNILRRKSTHGEMVEIMFKEKSEFYKFSMKEDVLEGRMYIGNFMPYVHSFVEFVKIFYEYTYGISLKEKDIKKELKKYNYVVNPGERIFYNICDKSLPYTKPTWKKFIKVIMDCFGFNHRDKRRELEAEGLAWWVYRSTELILNGPQNNIHNPYILAFLVDQLPEPRSLSQSEIEDFIHNTIMNRMDEIDSPEELEPGDEMFFINIPVHNDFDPYENHDLFENFFPYVYAGGWDTKDVKFALSHGYFFYHIDHRLEIEDEQSALDTTVASFIRTGKFKMNRFSKNSPFQSSTSFIETGTAERFIQKEYSDIYITLDLRGVTEISDLSNIWAYAKYLVETSMASGERPFDSDLEHRILRDTRLKNEQFLIKE